MFETLGVKTVDEFLYSLTHALTLDGILVSQAGPSPKIQAAQSSLTAAGHALDEFSRLLQTYGMQRMKTYTESHGQLMGPWEFRIFFKGASVPRSWCQDEDPTTAATMALQIAQRTTMTNPATSGITSLLRYFDGPTFLSSYQYPNRIHQHRFCQEHVCRDHFDGRQVGGGLAYDTDMANIPVSALEVKTVRKKALQFQQRKGVFVAGVNGNNNNNNNKAQMYPRASYLLLEENVHRLVIKPHQLHQMQQIALVAPKVDSSLRFFLRGCTRTTTVTTKTMGDNTCSSDNSNKSTNHNNGFLSCHILIDQPQTLSLAACQFAQNHPSDTSSTSNNNNDKKKKEKKKKKKNKNNNKRNDDRSNTTSLESFCGGNGSRDGVLSFYDPHFNRHYLAYAASEANRLPFNVTVGTELAWDCPLRMDDPQHAHYDVGRRTVPNHHHKKKKEENY